jgi:hypothetical protein
LTVDGRSMGFHLVVMIQRGVVGPGLEEVIFHFLVLPLHGRGRGAGTEGGHIGKIGVGGRGDVRRRRPRGVRRDTGSEGLKLGHGEGGPVGGGFGNRWNALGSLFPVSKHHVTLPLGHGEDGPCSSTDAPTSVDVERDLTWDGGVDRPQHPLNG